MIKRTYNKKYISEENFCSYEELYRSINEKGSLGLLALGYHGLKLWRKKKEEKLNSNKPHGKLNEEK